MLTIEELERQLHVLSPLEKKCKALRSEASTARLSLTELLALAYDQLADSGNSFYAQRFEPVGLENGFITFTDNSDISAFYQSRHLPVYEHAHDFIEIIYVYEGQCELKSNGMVTPLRKGDLCIVSPACRHDHTVMDDTSIILLVAIRCTTFNSTFLSLMAHQDILSDFFLKTLYNTQSQQSILFRTGDDPGISRTILEMHFERTVNLEFRGAMLTSLLSKLLLLVLRNHREHFEILDSRGPLSANRMVPILRYLQTHIREVTLTDLARQFGYSVPRLSRLIKDGTGKTYNQIVRGLRARQAAELLENPGLSMLDIVDFIGYCDVSHFYKDFKCFYQETPVQYRRRVARA